MEARIYGVIDSNNCQIDTSKTIRGCKRYASIHGYTKISYRIGYYVFIFAEKKNKKWITL